LADVTSVLKSSPGCGGSIARRFGVLLHLRNSELDLSRAEEEFRRQARLLHQNLASSGVWGNIRAWPPGWFASGEYIQYERLYQQPALLLVKV
jgi:hypothetical protein